MAGTTPRRNIIGFDIILVLHVQLVPACYVPPFSSRSHFQVMLALIADKVFVKIVCTSMRLELFCQLFNLIKKER